MTITTDGQLSDWTASDRLERPTTTVDNYEIYGRFEDDTFHVAIRTSEPGVSIGAGTTLWLNTDDDTTTGHQIFGFAGGVEFQVEVGTNGTAQLFSLDSNGAQTLVTTVQTGLAADGSAIEFAIPRSALGANVDKLTFLADVNMPGPEEQGEMLPNDYTFPGYTITDPASLPQPTNGMKVAIVYSATSAANYFGEMAYSQLIMAAQSQAMAAGIPFDVISEADLTNLDGLINYDAIIFPSFASVPDNYAEIVDVLTELVYDYHVPIITAGDFMTNDKDGNPLPSAYSTMQNLLGIERTGNSSNVTADIVAADDGHPITEGYGPDGAIRTYEGYYTGHFDGFGSTPTTVIAEQMIGGTAYNAVISTLTGGRNVHFANESLLADNNLLGQALDWSLDEGSGPQVSLHMSRNGSIVATRVDMDQSQESFDVDGGIYDSLGPILQDWKTQYDFVASYYINVGYYPDDDQQTNWADIGSFYQSLLDMGNEIGSHSYTHPFDTNLLFGDGELTQERFDEIVAGYAAQDPSVDGFTPYQASWFADPAISAQLNAMTLQQINDALAAARAVSDPTTLTDPIHKALIEATYDFQFAEAIRVIEEKLGIEIEGTAVPGMPDNLDTAKHIIEYAGYLSGGGSLVGAGYPGAFGYLDADADKVYIAPNMSFDFTLAGFGGMTPEQALEKWLQEYTSITTNSDMPIAVWPWHDYGPTEWPINFPDTGSDYTKEMFRALIEHAYQDGAEFVTLADLAARIATFQSASFNYTVTGDSISVTATAPTNSLGSFALDFDSLGGKVIASVAGWYAYDEDSVFLDADGGSFDITLGTVQADVTRITSIGSRAQLVSLDGSGVDLSFVVKGEGKITVDLKLLDGYFYAVTGATILSQTGDIMVLQLDGLGTHNVSIQQINDAPTDILLQNVSLIENTTTRTKIADLLVIDPDTEPGLSDNVVTISDPRFEYDPSDGGLYLKAGQAIDFEATPTISITVTAKDGALEYSKDLVLDVTDVNEAPTDIVVTNQVAVAENVDVRTKVADLAVTDPDTVAAFRNNTITVDDPRFEIDPVDGGLYLKAGQVIDFEAGATINLNLTASDGTFSVTKAVALTITDVNEAPTDIVVTNQIVLPENTAVRTKVADLAVADPDTVAAFRNNVVTVDDPRFEIDAASGDLYLKAGQSLDFNNEPTIDLQLTATDGAFSISKQVAVSVADRNEAPTDIVVTNQVAIAENTTARTKIADLAVTDPDLAANLRNNVVTVDDPRFEIDAASGDLYLKAGQVINFEAGATIALKLTATDATTPSLSVSKTINVAVTNVNEAPTDILVTNKVSIAEGTATRTKIADLAVVDPDTVAAFRNNTVTVSDSRFEIDTASGDLYLKAGQTIDFETEKTIAIALTAKDGALSFSKTVSVTVIDRNEAPLVNDPLGIPTVAEFAADGTVVTGLSATDSDAGDKVTFSLVDDAGGRFRIVGDELHVANGILLDYEQATSHEVVIRATDAQGASTEKTLKVVVANVDPEKVVGTAAADTIVGGSKGDEISGMGGADTLRGGAGKDMLDGGGGKDQLFGGNGKDQLFGGRGNDMLDGGKGADVLNGGAGKDQLFGGNGKDQLFGNGGKDMLDGGNGADMLDGGGGKDKLFGGNGKDQLFGGAGADELDGGNGADILSGGAGRDTLYASKGRDVMSGDGGADVFTFRDFRDSRDNGKRDVITDFSRSQKDKIDLSAIDANTNTNADDRFDFIGTDSFSATAGELRFQQNNNKTFVYGDVDGDGKADFSFQLNGSIDLKQGDFML